MSEVQYLKRGDLYFGIEYKLSIYAVGSNVLAGATAKFRAMDTSDVTLIEGNATVFDPDGILRYTFQTGETDIAGALRGEFEVIFPGSLPATFPNDGFLTVAIGQDVPLKA